MMWEVRPFRSRAEAAGWIAGFIDGEGTVPLLNPRGLRKVYVRSVTVINTDQVLMATFIAACQMVGIETGEPTLLRRSERDPRLRDCWRVSITHRGNLEQLQRLVPLRSPEKRRRLDALVTSYQQRQYRWRDVPIEAIRTAYFAGATVHELAHEYRVSVATIHRWMTRAGIPRRPRGAPAWSKRQTPGS